MVMECILSTYQHINLGNVWIDSVLINAKFGLIVQFKNNACADCQKSVSTRKDFELLNEWL